MGEGHTSGNRFSVYEAAEVMGITADAIRKRVARGTIPHEKDDDGRVWVVLDTDQDTASKVRDTDQPQSDKDALISEMRERVASLERQLESERQANSEHRRLLAAALERIPPQLESPSESPGSEASPTPTGDTSTEPTEGAQGGVQGPPRRRWWRRMFGEIYRLMTILESSSTLADYGGTYEGDRGKVEFLRGLEFPEVSRIVVSLAAIIRAARDADPQLYAGGDLEMERPVGVLMPDATRPDACESLEFREACNKVIHAKRVDPKRTVGTGALTGELILHGDYREKNWQARLELREFALAALALTP